MHKQPWSPPSLSLKEAEEMKGICSMKHRTNIALQRTEMSQHFLPEKSVIEVFIIGDCFKTQHGHKNIKFYRKGIHDVIAKLLP